MYEFALPGFSIQPAVILVIRVEKVEKAALYKCSDRQ